MNSEQYRKDRNRINEEEMNRKKKSIKRRTFNRTNGANAQRIYRCGRGWGGGRGSIGKGRRGGSRVRRESERGRGGRGIEKNQWVWPRREGQCFTRQMNLP